jgi:aspartyl-tRNA(Asn)/glutamyl-tRNA(Gln) amidotransferase subunit C
MKLSREDVDKLAHLARLDFSDKEKEAMMQDMDKILGFVDKISELDLEGVEPLIYMSDERNVLRKDESKSVVTKDEALKNAPDRDTDFFRVPKVLKREED